MRLTRNRPKLAAKRRKKLRSTDGPQCPHCEPRVNGKLKRETLRAVIHHQEIEDA